MYLTRVILSVTSHHLIRDMSVTGLVNFCWRFFVVDRSGIGINFGLGRNITGGSIFFAVYVSYYL